MKQHLLLFIAILTILLIGGIRVYQHGQYTQQIKALAAINSRAVTTFRIYPRVTMPVGDSITFNASESIISEFFQALKALSPYSPNHDTVASWDHDWFLIVSDGSISVQIKFHIPYGQGNIVVGEFAGYQNAFQSRQLFQWYHTYSHRWLTPEGSSYRAVKF